MSLDLVEKVEMETYCNKYSKVKNWKTIMITFSSAPKLKFHYRNQKFGMCLAENETDGFLKKICSIYFIIFNFCINIIHLNEYEIIAGHYWQLLERC